MPTPPPPSPYLLRTHPRTMHDTPTPHIPIPVSTRHAPSTTARESPCGGRAPLPLRAPPALALLPRVVSEPVEEGVVVALEGLESEAATTKAVKRRRRAEMPCFFLLGGWVVVVRGGRRCPFFCVCVCVGGGGGGGC